MNLDKAIEVLSGTAYSGMTAGNPNFKQAVMLGIQALIRERNNRINPGAYLDTLLPGETKD